MKKTELEKINIHTDNTLFYMNVLARDAVGNLCTYMQEFTEFGPEYMAAYNQHKKLMRELEKYEHLLAQCAKHRKGGKKEDEGHL